MKLLRRLIVLVLFVGLLVLGWNLAAANNEPMTIHYLLGEWTEIPALAGVVVCVFCWDVVDGDLSFLSGCETSFGRPPLSKRVRTARERSSRTT